MKMEKPDDYRLKAWEHVKSADYKKAFQIIEKALKIWPDDFLILADYACILGDYAESRSSLLCQKYKRKACEIFKGLMRQLRGKSDNVVAYVLNEYYYHSGQRKKQYSHGVKTVSKGLKARGYYSQGVGAAWHASELARNRSAHWAHFWAKRAIKAWERYFGIERDYYNSYVHYALALGIMGRFNDMEKALLRSGKLSGKPQSYKEFEEVRDIINKL